VRSVSPIVHSRSGLGQSQTSATGNKDSFHRAGEMSSVGAERAVVAHPVSREGHIVVRERRAISVDYLRTRNATGMSR
jgi:hypothetical protein